MAIWALVHLGIGKTPHDGELSAWRYRIGLWHLRVQTGLRCKLNRCEIIYDIQSAQQELTRKAVL